MQLALYQPDMPTNAGAALRLAACLDLPLVVIEPCGFVWDDRRVRRVALDYLAGATLLRMASWSAFEARRRAEGRRLVLLTTRAETTHLAARYHPDDVLLAGRESAGVPEEVHGSADLRVRVWSACRWRPGAARSTWSRRWRSCSARRCVRRYTGSMRLLPGRGSDASGRRR